ncbi:MAG: hypothetical protein M1838_001707 [Thelocarpon superellum]|nr:MAG: hypothetical protein M1838_001707 [Thelocarpon superellum]
MALKTFSALALALYALPAFCAVPTVIERVQNVDPLVISDLTMVTYNTSAGKIALNDTGVDGHGSHLSFGLTAPDSNTSTLCTLDFTSTDLPVDSFVLCHDSAQNDTTFAFKYHMNDPSQYYVGAPNSALLQLNNAFWLLVPPAVVGFHVEPYGFMITTLSYLALPNNLWQFQNTTNGSTYWTVPGPLNGSFLQTNLTGALMSSPWNESNFDPSNPVNHTRSNTVGVPFQQSSSSVNNATGSPSGAVAPS